MNFDIKKLFRISKLDIRVFIPKNWKIKVKNCVDVVKRFLFGDPKAFIKVDMRLIGKKLFGLLMIFSLLLFTPGTIFAQTITPAPIDKTADNSTNSGSLFIPDQDPSRPALNVSSDSILPSANLRRSIFSARLSKASFQAKEKVELKVLNADSTDKFTATLENDQDREIKAHIDKKYVNGEFIFSINPEVGFRPGDYSVKVVNDITGEVIMEQDFKWGVLAINTNKSIYLGGESAKIGIGVLDELGMMACDARVTLTIESPTWEKTVLSTDNGGIVVNRECMIRDITEKPDYEATYLTGPIGRYHMSLTAVTLNGSYTVSDRFEVRASVPFDVERITATRIFPSKAYPVTMKIKANQAFRGKIIESVPQDFTISKSSDDSISFAEESVIPQSYDPKKETGIPSLRLPFNDKYVVSLGFGEQIDDPLQRDVYKKSGLDAHDGIDFALPSGTPILAVDGGKILLAQEKWIYGTSVVIQHSWGRSYYGHLSKLEVQVGEEVSAGQEIGLSGSTGLSTGPHLHFSLKPVNSDIENLYFGKIDPAPFFGLANEDTSLSVADYPIAAKALVWYVDIEKGAEFSIAYNYQSPLTSPYFYTIGPLQFITSDIPKEKQAKFDVKENPFVLGEADSASSLQATPSGSLESTPSTPPVVETPSNTKEEVDFQEIRQWQIAADRTDAIILDANADGTCGSGCWTVPADWTTTNTITTIGAGGAGDNTDAAAGEGGGGGGAWARIVNANISGDVGFNVATGGTDGVQPGAATWFCNSTSNCTGIATSAVIVSADSGTTATGVTGGAGGDLTGVGPNGEFEGGAGGTGAITGADSAGGGGGAGSPNGTGGTGGAGDSVNAGEENSGGGGGSGCDAIGTTNDGTLGTDTAGGTGGSSCFAAGGSGGDGFSTGGNGSRGSGGGGGDEGAELGELGGHGGSGLQSDDPSLAGGGGGGGDDDGGTGGSGGYYGGGGGGGAVVGVGRGGVIVITYQVYQGNLSLYMRHGKWFNNGVEQAFEF